MLSENTQIFIRFADEFEENLYRLSKRFRNIRKDVVGVIDQIQEIDKRLNYFFYEIVYDWAKKKSFYSIKE
jgi:mRNA-degrading endonuclease RelE of RelBE toxin-antitoxin system